MPFNWRRDPLALFQRLCFFKHVPTTKVYFQSHTGDVSGKIIELLSQNVNIIRQAKKEDCDVSVLFCPIASRAGTDIEAALCGVEAEKSTLVFVLHHTFDTEYTAPESSWYGNNNRKLVDVLYHEDLGLLTCVKNSEAIDKATDYIRIHSKRKLKVHFKRVLILSAILGFFVCTKWLRPAVQSTWMLPLVLDQDQDQVHD